DPCGRAGADRLRHVRRQSRGGGAAGMSAVLDFPVKPEARPYLDAFDGRERSRAPSWLAQSRRRGMARFAELGFPTPRSGGWRYLDLQPLQQKPLLPAEQRSEAHEAA